jgi:hypothetical protein
MINCRRLRFATTKIPDEVVPYEAAHWRLASFARRTRRWYRALGQCVREAPAGVAAGGDKLVAEMLGTLRLIAATDRGCVTRD